MTPPKSPVNTAEPLSPESKSVLKIVFVTLFLDLIGFSIIFPLFPAMLTYYLEREGESGLVGMVVNGLERFSQWAGSPTEFGIVVLFGGVLGSLYSLLQFVFAPILGSLSDRYGRRPILLFSISGLALSYFLWCFAGSFLLLIVARTIGGIMSGNISTATAVVADVTTPANRPRGMAIIGIAFGLGFILGPAIGGFSAALDLTQDLPALVKFGLNPFSAPALAALILSLANLAFVSLRFPETLRPSSALYDRPRRAINPLKLFRTYDYPGVTRTNWANFLFITAFAGMEFSLTFLAMDRLDYGPRQNAYMFLFVGLVLTLVQGGYVRRQSAKIGPKRMAVQGLATTIPGLLLVGLAQSSLVLYAGLFLMAVGSAQVIPCLTALASVYAPPHEQGRILGIYRSLGSLARGIGPLIACVLYWRLGAGMAYVLGAASLLAPLAVAASLPKPSRASAEA